MNSNFFAMTEKNKKHNCLKCNEKMTDNNPYYPFCSKRCKEVDLGKWFLEEYKVKVDRDADIIEDEG